MTQGDGRAAYASVLLAVLELLAKEGAPPPAQNISQRTGLHADYVRRVLRQLTDDGALIQPYGERGPYVPLRRPDGTPVRVLLVDAEDPPHSASSPVVPTPDPGGLTVRETAEQLRVTERTIHRMIRDGRLKAEKLGMEWRIDPASAGVQAEDESKAEDTEEALHALIDELPEAKREVAAAYLRFLVEQG